MIKEDWIKCKLGDLLTLKNGFAFKSSRYTSEGIPVIRIGDINDWIVDESQAKCIAEEDEYDKYIVEKGDILIAMSGATTGKFGIYNSIRKAYQNQRVGNLKLNSKKIIDKKYIFNLLYSLKFQIEKDAYGGAQPNISAGKIHALKTVLAPLPEQRAIVAKIEELFSDLDKGVADLKKAQDQLRVYRQAVLKKAFEGELTQQWRNKNTLEPSFNFLKEIVKERKEAEVDKKSIYHKKISHEFEFSQDTTIKTWSKGTLDKLIYIAARIGWRGLKKSEYTEEGHLFMSVHSLNHGKYVDYTEAYHISEERYIESPEIQLQEGDVLLCKDGAGIGKIGIVKDLPSSGSVNSSLLVIRGMNILSQEFIYYLFSGPKLQSIVSQRITGSATPHLFQNDIRKFELLIPPIEEQHQIVQEIETRLSVCDKVEESITESLEKAKALRQSILKKAFEGSLLSEEELTACKAAKDYEPASVLLEKIKLEIKK